eukprot:scaffold222883_cov33-Tisochrysis_lutea.AAC.1
MDGPAARLRASAPAGVRGGFRHASASAQCSAGEGKECIRRRRCVYMCVYIERDREIEVGSLGAAHSPIAPRDASEGGRGRSVREESHACLRIRVLTRGPLTVEFCWVRVLNAQPMPMPGDMA